MACMQETKCGGKVASERMDASKPPPVRHPSETLPSVQAPIWSSAIRTDYINFVTSKKTLSANSVHSYCWRVESLLKALAASSSTKGGAMTLPLCSREDVKELVETNIEEARALVKQDDRSSHYELLKQMLGIMDVKAAAPECMVPDLGEGGKKKRKRGRKGQGARDDGGGGGCGGSEKAWDPDVRQNYRIWLRSQGVKDRTCGSYCTYVHNLLRVLLDKDNEQASAAAAAATAIEVPNAVPPNPLNDGVLPLPPPLPPPLPLPAQRQGGLNQEALVELLTRHAEEADAQVKLSKKTRYLRSFREFLGIVKPSATRKTPLHFWYDRFGFEYKHWLGRKGMAENGRARSRGYLGAARSMLRLVRRQGWIREAAGCSNGGGTSVTRQMAAAAIESHRAELSKACDTADDERVGAFLEYLQAQDEEVSQLPIVDYMDESAGGGGGDDEEDDDEEDDGEDGDVEATGESQSMGGISSAASFSVVDTESATQGAQGGAGGAGMAGPAKMKRGLKTEHERGSKVKQLQKRVRELELLCAEKDKECEARRYKIARLEQELQTLRAASPVQGAALSAALLIPAITPPQGDLPQEIHEQLAQLQAAYISTLEMARQQQQQQQPPALVSITSQATELSDFPMRQQPPEEQHLSEDLASSPHLVIAEAV